MGIRGLIRKIDRITSPYDDKSLWDSARRKEKFVYRFLNFIVYPICFGAFLFSMFITVRFRLELYLSIILIMILVIGSLIISMIFVELYERRLKHKLLKRTQKERER